MAGSLNSGHLKTERFSLYVPMHQMPTEELGKLLCGKTGNRVALAKHECRDVVEAYETFCFHQRWRDFASSWEEFRDEWFKCPQEWLDHVRDGLQILNGEGHSGDVTAEEAVAKSLEVKAQEISPVASVGAPKGNQNSKKEEENKRYVITFDYPKTQRGTSQDYLLARIKRDRPDIIPKIGENKEFKSARAAAIHCGIVKAQKKIYLSTPQKIAQKLKEQLQPYECVQLADVLSCHKPVLSATGLSYLNRAPVEAFQLNFISLAEKATFPTLKHRGKCPDIFINCVACHLIK